MAALQILAMSMSMSMATAIARRATPIAFDGSHRIESDPDNRRFRERVLNLFAER